MPSHTNGNTGGGFKLFKKKTKKKGKKKAKKKNPFAKK